MVVWKGLDARSDHIAAQTQLDWNAGHKELLLKGGVQTAHVAQPVWLEVQHLVRLCRCVYLQTAPLAVWARRKDSGLCAAKPKQAHSRSLESTLQDKAGQGRQGNKAGQGTRQGKAGRGRARQGKALLT